MEDGRKFISRKPKFFSEETRRKISESKKGKHHSEESKRKMSESHKGKIASEETRKKIGDISRGRRHSEETKRKISNSHIGIKPSEDTRKKMSINHKGKQPQEVRKKISETMKRRVAKGTASPGLFHKGHKLGVGRKGVIYSEESKKKKSESQKIYMANPENRKRISLSLKGRYKGEKSPSWKGGPNLLEKIIRRSGKNKQWKASCLTRDNWTCRTCGIQGGRLEVHHTIPFKQILEDNQIFDREQALKCNLLWDIDNGITLCTPCHRRTEQYLKSSKRREMAE